MKINTGVLPISRRTSPKPYEQVAIFAHGGILLNAQIYAGIIKPEEAFGALTPYGGIVKIELS